MLDVIQEYDMAKNDFVLYASEKSVGEKIKVGEKIYFVKKLCEENIEKVDIALFATPKTISQKFAKSFIKKGAFVIDNSNAFRRRKNVPLVVPEINADTITTKTRLISNPNCSTIGLVMTLFALLNISKIKRVVVSTYQAVSGAGSQAIFDLENGTNKKLAHIIKNNLIPHIDVFKKNLYTLEEDKLIFETQKILNKKIPLSATAVRVPIKNCHSESVNIEFEKPIRLSTAIKALKGANGITLLDDTENKIYPMPIFADGKDDIFVGRVRRDFSKKNCINLFISFDNIRKGAASNAVQIAMFVAKKFL